MKYPEHVLIIDNGLFFFLAQKLSPFFERVHYYTPWNPSSPSLAECVIGDGFDNVERCDDYELILPKTQLIIFTNIGHVGFQKRLEREGKWVWGPRAASDLEAYRGKLLNLQDKLGMPHPETKVVKGLTALRKHLMEVKDRFIKMDRYRADFETFHHSNYDESEPKLDRMAVRFGPLKEEITFYVQRPVKTDIETGGDGIFINHQFLDYALHGYEKKDKAYIVALTPYDEIPDEVRSVNDSLTPELTRLGYRGALSTEIRVAEEPMLIDLTCRFGFPSGPSQMCLYANLAEIIREGAQGNPVGIQSAAKYAVEILIEHNGDRDEWRSFKVPDEIKDRTALISCCSVNGCVHAPPTHHEDDWAGSVVGIGETVMDAIEDARGLLEYLKDAPVTPHTEALPDLLAEIQEAEDKGIEFGEEQVPEPEEGLQV